MNERRRKKVRFVEGLDDAGDADYSQLAISFVPLANHFLLSAVLLVVLLRLLIIARERRRNQHGGHRTHSCFGFITELPKRCIGVLLQKMHPAIAIILTAHQQYQNRVTIFRQTWIYARKTSPTRKQTGHFGSAPSNTLRHQCRLCWVEILPRVKSSK